MSRMGWERVEDRELQESEDTELSGRLAFMRLFFVVILGLLLYRVFWLQQTRSDLLQTKAEENQFAVLSTDAPRGVMFDRNGEPLAINLTNFSVTITPAFLPSNENERQAVFERLSLLTGVPVTNTVQQDALIASANPELVSTYSRLAQIYGADPSNSLDQAGVVPRLPNSIAGIVEEFSFAQYIPAVITSNIPITLAYQIEQESLFLPGVQVIPEPLREYPSGMYTAHIIGFMGPIPNEGWIDILGYQRDDRVGWAGLESSMELELAGTKGERRIEQDWTGRELRQIGVAQEPVAGLNMHLTLDLDLQIMTHQIVEQALQIREGTARRDEVTGAETYQEIRQAAVVAIDPQTGEVLAMVSFPTFDNNRFQTEVPVDYYLGLARDDYRPLVNHAISSVYPPGSTFKMVPAAGALQEGLVSPLRRLQAQGEIVVANQFAENDPGRPDQLFVCWNREGHGPMDAVLGIANSCDIYFYKITGGFDQDGEFVEGLGIDRLENYATQFGYGRVQGIQLPLENPGFVPTRAWKAQVRGEPWSTGDNYNVGIGQGDISATPLQVAQMVSVIANGGFLYRPSIIHHMSDENGNVVFINEETSEVVARAYPDSDGNAVIVDASGSVIENPDFVVNFDANGQYIYQPEVVDALEVDREYLEVVQEGMRLVNVFDRENDIFYTGATYVEWLDPWGITSAGKTGTAEYCDNIAIEREWCRYEDILERRILPTHSWYVGYAPLDDPEIVVAAFVFNGGEGSAWAAPIACNVMAAYFGLGQYMDRDNMTPEAIEEMEALGTVCQSLTLRGLEIERP